MPQKRFKDAQWVTEYDPRTGQITSTEGAILQVLCDVRDEMKKQNALTQRLVNVLECRNALAIPGILRKIDKRLAKKIPLR